MSDLFDFGPDLPPVPDDSTDADPFLSLGPVQSRPRKSRASIIATNASALSVAACAPAGSKVPEVEAVPEKRRSDPGTKYTTKYGKAHGKALGWLLLKSESYNYRTKLYHDIQLGMDLMFQTPDGITVVQCTGIGERMEHWRRFEGLDGPRKAVERGWGVQYWEFSRKSETPARIEVWA